MTREEFMEKFDFGNKIKLEEWTNKEHYYTIKYLGENVFIDDCNNECSYDRDWEHYQEPKKTVKKWLWAHPEDPSELIFATEKTAEYIVHNPTFETINWIKIEGTETEVEE